MHDLKMIMLILAGGLAAWYFMKTAVNYPMETHNTVWQALDPRRYLPGLMHGEIQDKRERVGQPQINIRSPFGPSNVFQKNIEHMEPFVQPDYSMAYARNYSNVTEIRTPDWRLDPKFAGTLNNYSGWYVTEAVVDKLSKHFGIRDENRWKRPR